MLISRDIFFLFYFSPPSAAVFPSFVATVEVYLWAGESYTLCDNALRGFV